MHGRDYLIKRGMRYSFRIKVPTHLHHLVGRIEIRRALGTADYNKARMQAQRMAWITLRLFEAMTNNRINLTSQQISDHLNSWYEKMMERDLEVARAIDQGAWIQSKADYQQSMDEMGFQLIDLLEASVDRGRELGRPDWDQPRIPSERKRTDALIRAVELMEWMGEEDDTVAVLSGDLPSLGELEEIQKRELIIAWLMKAVKVYSDKQLQQSGVASGNTRQPPNAQRPITTSSIPEKQSVPSCSLSEAWERYHSEKSKSKATWDGKLPDTARLAITDMVEFCGDVAVSEITREQCKDFRDLQAIKPRDKLKAYKGWGLDEILERAEEVPEKDRRKGGRPQEIINQVSTFFQWMVDEQILDKTVASNLKVKQIEGAITKPWTSEQLTTLFSQSNIAENAGIANTRSNQQSLPLVMTLLLYTGARLDEICYLKSGDFVGVDPNSEGTIPTIIIRRLTVDGLKTPAATRKIPLHPDLKTLGVIDFFKHRIAGGNNYLLDIPTKGDGRGNSVTQRFGAYRDNLGWEAGSGQSIRSFRKTLNTALVGKTDSEDRHRLMGHSLGNVNDSNYTERLALSLDRTYAALCSVSFGLELSSLRVVLERFVPDYPIGS